MTDPVEFAEKRSASIADWAPPAALACALLIVFASLETFSFGVWRNAEPVVVAFHATSALCAAALLVVLWQDASRFRAAVAHPFVVIPASISLWSVLTAPFAEFPLVALLGSPQSGEGALWYANLAVFVACGLCIRDRPVAWRCVVTVAAVVAIIVAGIKWAAAARGTYALFWISDFVAYPAMALPILVVRYADGRWSWLSVFVVAASAAILAVAENKAAITLFLAGAVALAVWRSVMRWPGTARVLSKPIFGAGVVACAAICPYFLIRFGSWADWFPSLHSRHLLARVMEEAQDTSIGSLIGGHGWGHTQGAMVSHLNAAQQNVWNVRWDFLTANYSHSHNWLTESLYSGGVPGLVLIFILFLAISIYCEPRLRDFATVFAASLIVLNGVWFPLSFFVPFQALAMAAVADTTRGPALSIGRRPMLSVVAGVLCLQVVSAATLFAYGLRVTDALHVYRDPAGAGPKFSFPADFRGAEYAFAMTARNHISYLQEVNRMREDPTHRAQQGKVVAWIFEDMERRMESRPSTFLAISGVAVFTEIMYLGVYSPLKPTYEAKADLWDRWVATLLRLAPDRSDAALGYFSWLLKNDKSRRLAILTRRVLVRRPEDPVALYYLGAALLAEGVPENRRLAFDYLRRGLDRGIERFMPVDKGLKEQIIKTR